MRSQGQLAAPVVAGRPYLLAELAWAVAHEGALTVEDLLDRRTRLGLVRADREVAGVAAEAVLAELLETAG